MSAPDKHALDRAIDHVASRMVAVPDDPDMALRIAATLPDRSSRLGWLMPQFAAFGALAIAIAVWAMREQPASRTVLPSTPMVAVALPAEASAAKPAAEPPSVRTRPLEFLAPLELLERDFERALPALELSAIGPAALPATEALTVEPIEIGELPLTAETISANKM